MRYVFFRGIKFNVELFIGVMVNFKDSVIFDFKVWKFKINKRVIYFLEGGVFAY